MVIHVFNTHGLPTHLGGIILTGAVFRLVPPTSQRNGLVLCSADIRETPK